MPQNKNVILIAAASASLREEITNILGEAYFYEEVDSAAHAVAYLEDSEANPALLFICDQLSASDGLSLLKNVKETPALHEIPVIYLYGSDTTGATDAVKSGAEEVAAYPVVAEALKNRVKNLLLLHPQIYYKNIMENLVEENANQCLHNLGVCTCPICRNDIIALALNNLAPKYVNSTKGALFSKTEQLSTVFQGEVIAHIAAAAEIVKKNPRH